MITTTSILAANDFANYRDLGGALSFDKRVKPLVLTSQEIDLQSLLGDDFYFEVATVAETGADSGNLTLANYTSLLPYIKPVLIHRTLARLFDANPVSITAYGIQNHTNEHSNNISEKTLSRMITAEQSAAIHYEGKLVEYLDDNSANYSTWKTSNSTADYPRTAIRITKVENY